MRRRVVSPRLAGYLLLAVAFMVAGVVSGRGALIALGAPFALAAIAGTALRPHAAMASASVDRTTIDEGQEVTVSVDVRGAPGQVVELALVVPAGATAVDGNTRRVRLGPRRSRGSSRCASAPRRVGGTGSGSACCDARTRWVWWRPTC